jgi:hypothetical protein
VIQKPLLHGAGIHPLPLSEVDLQGGVVYAHSKNALTVSYHNGCSCRGSLEYEGNWDQKSWCSGRCDSDGRNSAWWR